MGKARVLDAGNGPRRHQQPGIFSEVKAGEGDVILQRSPQGLAAGGTFQACISQEQSFQSVVTPKGKEQSRGASPSPSSNAPVVAERERGEVTVRGASPPWRGEGGGGEVGRAAAACARGKSLCKGVGTKVCYLNAGGSSQSGGSSGRELMLMP